MVTSWRQNPLIYEMNTWTWLYELSEKGGKPVTLGTVPDAELDDLAGWGLDAIWLMGVWARSPAGQRIAQDHPGLQEEYRRALPDFVPEDVVGSPFSIYRYEVDPSLGGPDELAAIRQRLADRGLRLILDFVPNHVAPDHPWLEATPEWFIQGTGDDLAAHPDTYFHCSTTRGLVIVAHGRDPYFPAWTDTAQLNAFHPELRGSVIETLLDVAGQCDGVRCDMAMLVTNAVFARTWGERAGAPPAAEYWQEMIPAVKAAHPDFLFISEVYWNMEWELQQQGFDYTYDKRLYDRLRDNPVRITMAHIQIDLNYQRRLVRMIDNHDEVRAMTAFGPERSLAAAVLVATLPGATLFHEGQFTGHRVKLPVQLGRRPPEPDNPDTLAFYRRLLTQATQPVYHEGEWMLCETDAAWDLNASFHNLIAYSWRRDEDRRLVVVNYSGAGSQGRIALGALGVGGRIWHLRDVLHDAVYERDGNEMVEPGLYVDLKPWQSHLFEFHPADS